jgi:hypothetical protein
MISFKYGLSLSPLLDLLLVELQLLALKDIAISTSALPGSRADAGVQPLLTELVFELGFDHTLGLSGGELGLDGLGGLLDCLLLGFFLDCLLG